MSSFRFLAFVLFFCTSCYHVPDKINPRLDYEVQDKHFSILQSPFSSLSSEEAKSPWGRELLIAHTFAEQLDLYRAISTYKRAEILVDNATRKLEIQYDILLCYFLAKRYDEAVVEFDRTPLANVDKTFPAHHDLLLILYECYRELDWPERQQRILELTLKNYPETAEKLQISAALREGNLDEVKVYADGFNNDSYLDNLLDTYYSQKKSVATAQTLNALLPGAGYLYIGQKTSAFTALLLNGLFIFAATEFFIHGHNAAGIIATLFESGWYFGGIYGAGEEAKYYNERIYEKNASIILNDTKLFPVLMLNYGF
jgi:hypothetical protein